MRIYQNINAAIVEAVHLCLKANLPSRMFRLQKGQYARIEINITIENDDEVLSKVNLKTERIDYV